MLDENWLVLWEVDEILSTCGCGPGAALKTLILRPSVGIFGQLSRHHKHPERYELSNSQAASSQRRSGLAQTSQHCDSSRKTAARLSLNRISNQKLHISPSSSAEDLLFQIYATTAFPVPIQKISQKQRLLKSRHSKAFP